MTIVLLFEINSVDVMFLLKNSKVLSAPLRDNKLFLGYKVYGAIAPKAPLNVLSAPL